MEEFGEWPETPTPRFLFHRMLRREQLCAGGPRVCPDSVDGEVPCDVCPAVLFDRYLAAGPGMVIRNAVDLDFALQARMTVEWDAMNYYEFLLLRILAEERNKWHEEEMQKAQNRGRAQSR